jgi:hypothetical protein
MKLSLPSSGLIPFPTPNKDRFFNPQAKISGSWLTSLAAYDLSFPRGDSDQNIDCPERAYRESGISPGRRIRNFEKGSCVESQIQDLSPFLRKDVDRIREILRGQN